MIRSSTLPSVKTSWPDTAENYWRFRDAFAGVLDPRTHTIEWLDAQVWSGAFKVWCDGGSCVLTSIRPFPTGAFEVHIQIVTGDVETLTAKILPRIEEWAADIGALMVSAASRKAWARIMEPLGYETWQVELRKEV